MSDLKAIRARLEAATPGNWASEPGALMKTNQDNWTTAHQYMGDGGFDREDAELVVHAPDDIRHLLALLDECREVLRETVQPLDAASGGTVPAGVHMYGPTLAALQSVTDLLAKLGGPDGQ